MSPPDNGRKIVFVTDNTVQILIQYLCFLIKIEGAQCDKNFPLEDVFPFSTHPPIKLYCQITFDSHLH